MGDRQSDGDRRIGIRDATRASAYQFGSADRIIVATFMLLQLATLMFVTSQHGLADGQALVAGSVFGYRLTVFDLLLVLVLYFIFGPFLWAGIAVLGAAAHRAIAVHVRPRVRERVAAGASGEGDDAE